jgi:hypothetical protein
MVYRNTVTTEALKFISLGVYSEQLCLRGDVGCEHILTFSFQLHSTWSRFVWIQVYNVEQIQFRETDSVPRRRLYLFRTYAMLLGGTLLAHVAVALLPISLEKTSWGWEHILDPTRKFWDTILQWKRLIPSTLANSSFTYYVPADVMKNLLLKQILKPGKI